MNERQALVPNRDHPISITECRSQVLVKAGPIDIAETNAALTLIEADYGPVHYVPMADVDMSHLERSDHSTYCPYKGEAHYFSIPALGAQGVNVVWTYETPFEAVGRIAGHLAFYPDRVSVRIAS